MTTIVLHGHRTDFNSFTLTNRYIASGLRALGYDVIEVDLCTLTDLHLPEPPDVYIYHSFPYDAVSAPGKLNIFYLAYEYLQFHAADRHLVSRLNDFFDLMIVPSEFVKRACEASGVTIPIEVSLEAYAPAEFTTDAMPVTLPTEKPFKFLFLGGGIKRKGIDVLLKAYCAEFTHDDPVALVIKTFSYDRTLDWVRELLTEAQSTPDAPEIVFVHETEDSVAGYYTAADVGVFPYRGEGFGLPILECIASGRRVIVTRGGSTDDFCTDANAWFINAEPTHDEGLHFLEPDVAHLRRLMRSALESEPVSHVQRQRIAASVSDMTWENSAKRLHQIIQQYASKPIAAKPLKPEVSVASVIYPSGIPSKDEFAEHLRDVLAHTAPQVRHLGYADPKLPCATRLLIGTVGDVYEHLSDHHYRQFALIHDGLPAGIMQNIDMQERAVYDAKPPAVLRYSSLMLWRREQEINAADYIITFDQHTADYFGQRGKASVHILPPILPPHQLPPRTRQKVRVLLIATEAYRQGAHLLLEAWNQVQPRSAELLCMVEHLEVLKSPRLVKLLVKNPSITVKALKPREDYSHLFGDADLIAAPSLCDGVYGPVASATAYGRPAIISDAVGMSDYLTHGTETYVTKSGSVDALADGMRALLDNPQMIDTLSEACAEIARTFTAERFAASLAPILSTIPADSAS